MHATADIYYIDKNGETEDQFTMSVSPFSINDSPEVICEAVFVRLNAGSGREDWSSLAGRRSMSVGDIIRVRGWQFQCAPQGWEAI